jgi:hypothetical protein
VRDTIAVQGSGVLPDRPAEPREGRGRSAANRPDSWNTADIDGIRATLQQVVQALAKVEASILSVQQALAQVSARVQSAPSATKGGMEQMAQNFVDHAQPGYQSLLSITSALAGISRERVTSLLRLR